MPETNAAPESDCRGAVALLDWVSGRSAQTAPMGTHRSAAAAPTRRPGSAHPGAPSRCPRQILLIVLLHASTQSEPKGWSSQPPRFERRLAVRGPNRDGDARANRTPGGNCAPLHVPLSGGLPVRRVAVARRGAQRLDPARHGWPIVALVGVGCARATWEEGMPAVMHGPVVLAGSA